MKVLTRNKMVSGLDLKWKHESGLCELCVEGKVTGCPSNIPLGKGQVILLS